MTRHTQLRPTSLRSTALLLSASALALAATPAAAHEVLFSSTGRTEVPANARTSTGAGVLQVRLDNGATLSFVEDAEFQINDDGSVELFKGSVTVAGAGDSETVVRLPAGMEGRVAGTGNAGVFTAKDDGVSDGHVLSGEVTMSRGRVTRDFRSGDMWASSGTTGIRRVLARATERTPGTTVAQAPAPTPAEEPAPQVADMAEGGPVAAAENGLPVSLGDALAAAGASSDILGAARRVEAAAANPSLDTFPTGDLALLVARAGDLSGAYGGTPFPQAQADIIRAYLGYLAGQGSGNGFLSAYAGFLNQYLGLIRAGGVPSQFGSASQADINAFLAYQGRLGALAQLSAQNRTLAEAYLAFLQQGGNPDLFAGRYTDLIEAYFAYVRGGGDPAAFSGASTQVIDAYIAFLADSGLVGQLSPQDQDLLAAYQTNGSFAFAATYAAALQTYFGYLAAGNLPSGSSSLTPTQLRNYLEVLSASGQLNALLGAQAGFYSAYLEYLRGGSAVDQFPQLNANVFADYVPQLNAYYAYLLGGGLPTAYPDGDPKVLRAYLQALADAGALNSFLGDSAGFYGQYLAWLQTGGSLDGFAGLNANIFAGYAQALNAYYAFLAGGGLPSGYTALTQQQIAAYVAALKAQGASSAFLAGLAGFYDDYALYLAGGGNPDLYIGLPTLNLPAFAQALNAYAAYLAGGGLPGGYTALDLDVLAIYLDALDRSGELASLLGGNASLLSAYFAYLGTGADPDRFAGLPLYAGYVTALQDYYAFLAGGGLPAAYTALTAQQVRDYLAALGAAGGLSTQLGNLSDFYTAYFAFVSTGGAPNQFSGLPVYANYVTALNAYYAYLAGGGLPQNYGPLSAQQIADYLAALNAAGGFGAYGSLNAFFGQYYSFLAGGGDPQDYAGIPAYAGYVSALNAYYAYLAGGGLPANYSVLTQQQIADYLAALSGVQGGLGTFASLNAFFADYAAFVAGGGNPANYSGLPVYATYVSALNAYYAYLAGGGVPSAYTVLTQQQIADYLAALSAAGGFGAYASLNAFFVNYYTYLAGGGVPDNYGSLPGMGGGGTITPPVQLAYTGGFNPASARINFVTTLTLSNGSKLPGSEQGFDATAYTLNGSGGLTAYTRNGGTTRTSGTTTITDVSGNADMLIGRWTNGTNTGATPFPLTANQGFHYLLARPVADSFALPTQGRIDYELLAATRPTMVDGSVAPGTITADMAILLGTSHKVAFEATVTMPGAGGGANQVFRYATTGGLANASQSTTDLTVFANKNVQFRVDGVSGTNCTDVNTCYFSAAGIFGGDSDTLGITYTAVNDLGGAKTVIGAAIFGNGTLSGGAPPTITTYTGGFTPGSGTSVAVAARVGSGNLTYGTNSQGPLTSPLFDSATGVLSRYTIGTTTVTIDTARVTDLHGDDDLVIGRWTGGTMDFAGFGSLNDVVIAESQGLHYLLGQAPASPFVLPTGTMTYELLSATKPTLSTGVSNTGTFTGALALSFNGTASFGLGINATVAFNDSNIFTIRTPGFGTGSAEYWAADNVFLSDGTFTVSGTSTSNNAAHCNSGGCVTNLLAQFDRDGIERLGLVYNILLKDNVQAVSGAALFGNGTLTGGGSSTPTPITGAQASQHSITANYANFQDIYSRATNYDANGIIDSYTISNGSTWTRSGAQAPADEAGSVAGAIGWARWTSGNTQNGSLSANQGTHIISGTPATNLPTAGTVTYQLIGSTKPTDGDGLNAPGTFAGELAVDFASRKVGIDFDVTLGQFAWNLTTTGGAANPASSALGLSVNNQVKSTVTITGSNAASCVQLCNATVDGFLFGPGAGHFGITYGITDRQTPTQLLWVSGAAAFAAGSGQTGTIDAPGSQLATQSLGAAPAADWDRWELGAGGDTGSALMAQAPGIDATSIAGVNYSPEQLAQLNAFLAARAEAN